MHIFNALYSEYDTMIKTIFEEVRLKHMDIFQLPLEWYIIIVIHE